jgi:hypothetical protein
MRWLAHTKPLRETRIADDRRLRIDELPISITSALPPIIAALTSQNNGKH